MSLGVLLDLIRWIWYNSGMNDKKRLRAVWRAMRYRCYQPKGKQYRNYGGRGITVCREWLDFETFYGWAKVRWAPGLQIDREDNDDDYRPSNCRFVTCLVNNCNRSVRKDNPTGYTGVTRRDGRYRARIWHHKGITLGQFTNIEEAVVVRNRYIVANDLPHPIQEILDGGLLP